MLKSRIYTKLQTWLFPELSLSNITISVYHAIIGLMSLIELIYYYIESISRSAPTILFKDYFLYLIHTPQHLLCLFIKVVMAMRISAQRWVDCGIFDTLTF